MLRMFALAILLSFVYPTIGRADVGAALDRATGDRTMPWPAWNWDALVLFNLTLLAAIYICGFARLRRRTSPGRGLYRARAAAFYISIAVVFIALISPLDGLSEESASAHMLQHMLLMVVAAPLFMFAMPGFVLTWGIAPSWRAAAARFRARFDLPLLRRPLVPWAFYAAALWIWHLPAAYEAALVDPLVHDVQHLSFFGIACLFWRGLLTASPRRRWEPLAAVVALFTTSLHASLLGVFMASSREPWYDVYSRPTAWGLTPLEDQHLAGLIMWMPACLIYPAVAATITGMWLATLSRQNESPTGATPGGRSPNHRLLRGM